MAVCQSFAVHRESLGKRITVAVELADDPGETPADRQPSWPEHMQAPTDPVGIRRAPVTDRQVPHVPPARARGRRLKLKATTP
ncbi:hypothetical protein [Streptomyces roseolus]